jgi:hypothetical protein
MTTNPVTIVAAEPIAEVQAQINRADTKASILVGLSLAAVTGGAALVSKAHLHGLAVAGAVLTACLIGAALVLLGAAIRPAFRGNHGFVRWAAAPTVDALRDCLTDTTTPDDAVRQLWHLARSARRKYQRIRLAVDLLGAALASAALTAVLAGLGW